VASILVKLKNVYNFMFLAVNWQRNSSVLVGYFELVTVK